MSLRRNFQTDARAETEGVWFPVDENAKVLICRTGGNNKTYQRALERKTRPFRHLIDTKRMKPETADQILQELLAEHVVKGWQTRIDGEWRDGIQLDDGADLIPCNPENLKDVFDQLPELAKAISTAANDIATFSSEQVASDAKN